MGGPRYYVAEGGFSKQLYYTIDVIEADGLSGKVLGQFGVEVGHSNLPSMSNTSSIYFRMGKEGHIDQMRTYENRNMALDFDWGHTHRNIPKGVVHVQNRFTKETRLMNNEEIKKYGSILRKADPNVRFRP